MPHRVARPLLVLVALLLAGRAEAQIALDRTELVLRPDSAAQRSGRVVVRNTGRSRATAAIRIEDWDRGADGSHRFYEAGTQPGSCATVLTVSSLAFSLAPGESRALEVGLDGAVHSACWSLVLVESEERVRDAEGRMVLATVRTGLKVFAEPTGLRSAGEVSDLEVEQSASAHSVSALPAASQAAVTFRNTGERHLKAQGRLEIRRADDSVVTTLPLPLLQALPGATMTARVTLPAMPTGTYRLRAVVDYGTATAAAERTRELR
jgi:P pilus assembly chaperone PapD